MKKRAVTVLAVALILGGCTVTSNEDDYLGPDTIGDVPVTERGSFEDARTRLDTMVDEMAAALTEAFPDCPPMTRGGAADHIVGGGSPEDGANLYYIDAQSRLMECSVSDTRERADRAIEIVTTIADRYDFQPRITYNDRILPDGEGYVAFEGWNAEGDSYSFGSALYTTVSFTTAKRWAAAQLAAIEQGKEPPYIPRETFETTPPPATPEPTSAPETTPTSEPS